MNKRKNNLQGAGTNRFRTILYTLFFFYLFLSILTHSRESLYYAFNGLELWYSKMVPALMPFMILSGLMIRMGLSESFVSWFYPVFRFFFRISPNAAYAIIMGFLCGFPMGAKVTADLLQRELISVEEADFLLAFTNNIGPAYFFGFVLPLVHRKAVLPYLFGMYALPLLYGLLLRYTLFRKRIPIMHCRKKLHHGQSLQSRNEKEQQNTDLQQNTALSVLEQIDDAIGSAVHSILLLGGYMIFFNLLNLLPIPETLAPVLEITGGLEILGDKKPLLVFVLLPFGGFSCIAQTYSTIRSCNRSICPYILHKLVLSGITALYYAAWFLLFPASFLA